MVFLSLFVCYSISKATHVIVNTYKTTWKTYTLSQANRVPHWSILTRLAVLAKSCEISTRGTTEILPLPNNSSMVANMNSIISWNRPNLGGERYVAGVIPPVTCSCKICQAHSCIQNIESLSFHNCIVIPSQYSNEIFLIVEYDNNLSRKIVWNYGKIQ